MHILARLHQQHTNRKASKVAVSMGRRVASTNPPASLVSIQAALILKDILVAHNMAKPAKPCQARRHTDKAFMVHRAVSANKTSPTPRYLVANTTRRFLARLRDNRTLRFRAHQAHTQINPTPARQAHSITHRSLVLQHPNTTNPIPVQQAVRRTPPFLPSQVASMARHFLAHQADNPTLLYPVPQVVKITKPFLDRQPTHTAVQTLQRLPTHQRQGNKHRRLMGHKLPHRMGSKLRPLTARNLQLTRSKAHHTRLSPRVQRITNTPNRVSRASIRLNRSRTPYSRALRVATTALHHRHQWALIQASKAPIQASQMRKWVSRV